MRFVFKRKGRVLGTVGRGGIDRQVAVEVADEEECEACDFVVCVPAEVPAFDNDVIAKCSDCGRDIRHRPYAPKKPPKICMGCFVKRQEATD